VMAGTCAEYDWSEEILSERTTPLTPGTLYGACKHATHVAAAAVAEQLGVALAWGRVFFLYGPGEHPDRLVPSVARGLLAGRAVPTTEGYQRRDFMHVQDVANAFIALLESGVTGAVNIASGRPVAVRDLVDLIAETVAGPGEVNFGGLPSRSGEPAVITGETDRLTREVGFRATKDLRQGIAETVAWWRMQAEAA
jgi:nucleoside-diphosphate-sugar epimerase